MRDRGLLWKALSLKMEAKKLLRKLMYKVDSCEKQ